MLRRELVIFYSGFISPWCPSLILEHILPMLAFQCDSSLLEPCLLPFQRFVFAYNDNWTIGVIGWGRRETFLWKPFAFLKTKNGLVVQVLWQCSFSGSLDLSHCGFRRHTYSLTHRSPLSLSHSLSLSLSLSHCSLSPTALSLSLAPEDSLAYSLTTLPLSLISVKRRKRDIRNDVFLFLVWH